jgi:hypothetical protein
MAKGKTQKMEAENPVFDRYGDYPELNEDIGRARLFKVDPLKLNEEASVQPEILNFIGTNLARAKERCDVAHNEVKTVKAKVYLDFKRAALGGKSPTVEELKALVESHPDVILAQAEELAAKRTVDLVEADFSSAMSKGRMIEFFKREFERQLQYK